MLEKDIGRETQTLLREDGVGSTRNSFKEALAEPVCVTSLEL